MNVYYISSIVELFLAVNSVMLFIGFFVTRKTSNKFQKLFMILLILNVFMLIFGAIRSFLLFNPSKDKIILVKIVTFLSQLSTFCALTLYTKCVVEFITEGHKIKDTFVWVIGIVCGIFAVLCFISLFNEMFIAFNSFGGIIHGTLYLFLVLDVCLVPISIFVYSVFFLKYIQKNRKVLLVLFCLIPLLGMPFLFIWDIVPVYISFNISFNLLYVLYNVEQIKLSSEKDKMLVVKELELVESKNAIFLSQIQPHFLYNVLNSIYSLCDSDPEKAKLAIVDFSKYLRTNLDSLKRKELISFEEELNHVKAYLRLEKLRYNDLLEVVYDIKANNFKLPVLSVQPLVENAINHGLFGKENGGIIYIKTKEEDEYFEIRVIDEGLGFNENELFDPNRSHTGIDNVKSRLKITCNGTLEISSIKGVGTVATIKIPKEKNL